MNRITSDSEAELTVVGIDIGQDVFNFVGFDANGKIAFRRNIRRLALAETFKALPACIVGMEARLSAHFIARTLRGLGHEPSIIPAKYAESFAKGQKNDYNDAEAIADRGAASGGMRAHALSAICAASIRSPPSADFFNIIGQDIAFRSAALRRGITMTGSCQASEPALHTRVARLRRYVGRAGQPMCTSPRWGVSENAWDL